MKPKLLLIATIFFFLGLSASAIYSNLLNDSEYKITGIGGVFFKSKDVTKLKKWYKDNLNFNISQYGSEFYWRPENNLESKAYTQWSPFFEKTKYFEPSKKQFMINYTVVNLDELLKHLKNNNVKILDTIETYDYGKFLHILDIEGNKIELWEPTL